METIRVNMTPCEDIKTIHASQNDNEAREWGFELHNNGEKIDSSSISDQMVFKAYEGGTEQILPTNGSTPTTSPFKGDIKYPQGLLSGQEFLYRESPTESDGLAKITDIKGNTLVWNQLVQNGNFADTSNWVTEYTTFTVSNNVVSVVGTRNGNNYISQLYQGGGLGHKYYFRCDYYTPDAQTETLLAIYTGSTSRRTAFTPTEYGKWLTYEAIIDNDATDTTQYQIRLQSRKQGVTNQFRNCMVVDLTKTFGSGNEPTTVEQFTSLFSLPYYAYNQGTLLSFNGNGIKTVGKNLFNSADVITGRYVNDANGVFGVESNSVSTNYIEIFPNTEYKIISAQTTIASSGMWGAWYDANKTYISGFSNYTTAKTSPSNAKYMAFTISYNGRNPDYANNVMLLFNGEDETFEPYTSSTLSLPISTYFTNGMNGANNIYDELSVVKATKRFDGYTFTGNETWAYNSSSRFWQVQLPITNSAKTVGVEISSNGILLKFVNNNYARAYLDDNPSLSDSSAMNSVFSNGTQIVYELATYEETSFTTASLVTENAEIPLSNEDGVLIGKCTEQLSSESGFFDAKIKLADADGECYSNKIQLHIERKPS